MKASMGREPGEIVRANELKRLADRALGLRIALAGMRPEKHQSAEKLKIRARKFA